MTRASEEPQAESAAEREQRELLEKLPDRAEADQERGERNATGKAAATGGKSAAGGKDAGSPGSRRDQGDKD
jgi:hypothetical protein